MALTPGTFATVTARIDRAIQRNMKLEKLIIALLLTLFLSGIGLMIGGIISQRWDCFVAGGLSEVAIVYPIEKLMKLRKGNLLFEVFPALLQCADKTQTKQLINQFLKWLMGGNSHE